MCAVTSQWENLNLLYELYEVSSFESALCTVRTCRYDALIILLLNSNLTFVLEIKKNCEDIQFFIDVDYQDKVWVFVF